MSLRQEQLESLLAAASALGVVGLLQGAPNKGLIASFSWFWKLEDGEVEVFARFLLAVIGDVQFSRIGGEVDVRQYF